MLPINPVIRLDSDPARRRSGAPEYQTYRVLWLGIIHEINSGLKNAAENDPAVDYLDVATEMDLVEDKERFFVDFIHRTVEGNTLVAHRLAEIINSPQR